MALVAAAVGASSQVEAKQNSVLVLADSTPKCVTIGAP